MTCAHLLTRSRIHALLGGALAALIYTVGLFLTSCASAPVDGTASTEPTVALHVVNGHSSRATIYAVPCGEAANCRVRIGDVEGLSQRSFTLAPWQTGPADRVQFVVRLLAGPTFAVEPITLMPESDVMLRISMAPALSYTALTPRRSPKPP